jgi:Rad3-related DNA helicase
MGVFDFFPYESYRPYQKETLARIVEAFGTVDYVILESPRGSGKSAIAIALGLFYNSSYKTNELEILYCDILL